MQRDIVETSFGLRVFSSAILSQPAVDMSNSLQLKRCQMPPETPEFFQVDKQLQLILAHLKVIPHNSYRIPPKHLRVELDRGVLNGNHYRKNIVFFQSGNQSFAQLSKLKPNGKTADGLEY